MSWFQWSGWSYILIGIVVFLAIQCVLFATREETEVLRKRRIRKRRRHNQHAGGNN